jgi:archaemetzincin
MATIGLRAIGELEPEILAGLVVPLTATFGLEARVGPALPHADYAYDATRRQYHASLIRAQLQAARLPDEQYILGVFDGDLFVPQLNFAFGEASRRERNAVIGLARLRPTGEAGRDNELLQINREVVRAFSKGGINPAPTNDVPL